MARSDLISTNQDGVWLYMVAKNVIKKKRWEPGFWELLNSKSFLAINTFFSSYFFLKDRKFAYLNCVFLACPDSIFSELNTQVSATLGCAFLFNVDYWCNRAGFFSWIFFFFKFSSVCNEVALFAFAFSDIYVFVAETARCFRLHFVDLWSFWRAFMAIFVNSLGYLKLHFWCF